MACGWAYRPASHLPLAPPSTIQKYRQCRDNCELAWQNSRVSNDDLEYGIRSMFNRLIAILFLLFIALSSVVMFIGALLIWALTRWYDRRLVLLHLFSSVWASMYLWIMPAWQIRHRGRHHIDWSRTYVVVSNHQSLMDILLAFSLFFPFKWVSKIEIFRVPLIGWNMVLNRYIPLKRGNRDSTRDMMVVTEQRLNEGSSVYFFPEGTRSPSGAMKPFKPGAFILAKKMALPILPLVINGTKNSLPKHSLNFHGNQVCRIEVLPAIEPESFADTGIEELTQSVHQLIANQVDEHTTLASDVGQRECHYL
jgi:1-acyl-sn-glycerol-3-phosphate acyltransferase